MPVQEIHSNQELCEMHHKHRSVILCVYDYWRIPNSRIPGPLMESLSLRFPDAHFIKATFGILVDYHDSVIPLSVPHIVIYTNHGEIYADHELSGESSAELATKLISDYVSWTREDEDEDEDAHETCQYGTDLLCAELAQKSGTGNLFQWDRVCYVNWAWKARGESHDERLAVPKFWNSSVDNTE